MGRAREGEAGTRGLTISRISCAGLTPGGSVYGKGERVKMGAGGSFTKNWWGDCTAERKEEEPRAWGASGHQSRMQPWLQQPPFCLPWQSPCSMDSWFPAGSTSVLGGHRGGSVQWCILPPCPALAVRLLSLWWRTLFSGDLGAPHLPTRSPNIHTASGAMPSAVRVLRSQTAPREN